MSEMSECLILVDNSNIFIEGRKLSASRKGVSVDWSWRVDFGSLLKQVANGHKIINAILVGSTPPPNDSLWEAARSQGFSVKTYERSRVTGEEKVVDTEITASGLKVIYKHPRPAVLKLLSGDRDFVPLIRSAYEEGWETELWGFQSSISAELSQIVTRVQLLDDVFEQIG
ncbi:MAG: NYN domain-containing protein [Synergistaceae bacterium]|jgi:uncharacterized LabA/DUF88 family protein|nr:NYN domain-containing protein [Synergistaceae bacterium]